MDMRTLEWREDFWSDEENSYGSPNSKVLNFAKDFYQPGSSAIDIASGDGRYAVELAIMGYMTDALEYTESGVNRIREYVKNSGEIVDVFQGDFTKLCFKDRSYDLVLSSGLLEEIDKKHHENVVKGYQNWTKIGGLNIIKYCLEIHKRGQLVDDNFIPTFYENGNREILYVKEKGSLKKSNANIEFNDGIDSKIRTGTIVARKL